MRTTHFCCIMCSTWSIEPNFDTWGHWDTANIYQIGYFCYKFACQFELNGYNGNRLALMGFAQKNRYFFTSIEHIPSKSGTRFLHQLNIFLRKAVPAMDEYNCKSHPQSPTSTNKICVEWRLSRLNRFINIELQELRANSRRLLVLPPYAPSCCFFIFRCSKGILHWAESNVVCPSKIDGNYSIFYGGGDWSALRHKLSR